MQFIPIIVAAMVILILLAIPRVAKSAQTPVNAHLPVAPNAALFRSWPSKYQGGTLIVEIEDKASPLNVGMPALDAGSKDAAKMKVSTGTANTYDWIKDKWRCADVVVTAALPTGIVAQTHPVVTGNLCVASMKVPAGTPLSVHLDLSQAGGWVQSVQSVEGGHATADVVNEKVGPDHIIHKHIGGVKYENILLDQSGKEDIKVYLGSYAPQVPTNVVQPPK